MEGVARAVEEAEGGRRGLTGGVAGTAVGEEEGGEVGAAEKGAGREGWEPEGAAEEAGREGRVAKGPPDAKQRASARRCALLTLSCRCLHGRCSSSPAPIASTLTSLLLPSAARTPSLPTPPRLPHWPLPPPPPLAPLPGPLPSKACRHCRRCCFCFCRCRRCCRNRRAASAAALRAALTSSQCSKGRPGGCWYVAVAWPRSSRGSLRFAWH